MLQPKSRAAVLQAVEQYGPAPGGQKMLQAEEEAACMAIEQGMSVLPKIE